MKNDVLASIPLDDPPPVPAKTGDDRRPRMPEPPPVRLVTVEDARLVAGAGLEVELDAFYEKLLGFERETPLDTICYRAENFRLRFDVIEPPLRRDDLRALGIEVPALVTIEHDLADAQIPYTRLKGLHPGQESLLVQDPAGNWVELMDHRPMR